MRESSRNLLLIASTLLMGCSGSHACQSTGTIRLLLSASVPADKELDVTADLGTRTVMFHCPSLLSGSSPNQDVPGVGRIGCLGGALTIEATEVDIRAVSSVVVTVTTQDGQVYANAAHVALGPASESDPDGQPGYCERFGDLPVVIPASSSGTSF